MHRILPALLLLGCYGARELDPGLRDAGPIPDAGAPLPSCDRPPSEWLPTYAEFPESGPLLDEEDGDFYFVSHGVDGLDVDRVSDAGPIPTLVRHASLPLGWASSITIDRDRVATVRSEGDRAHLLEIRSLETGALLDSFAYEGPWNGGEVAMHDQLVAVLHGAAGGEEPFVLVVVDLTTGALELEELPWTYEGGSVALVDIDDRLHLVASGYEGTTELWSLSAEGRSRVERLDVPITVFASYGSLLSAYGPEATMFAWRPGSTLSPLDPVSDVGLFQGFGVTERAGEAWSAIGVQRRTIEFRGADGFRERRVVEGATGASQVIGPFPFASRAHRGAFVALRALHRTAWVGWSCDPTR